MENDRIWTLLTRKLSGAATATEVTELNDIIATDAAAEKIISAISAHWREGANTDRDFLEATYLQHLERMKTKGFSLTAEHKILDDTGNTLIAETQDTPAPYWKRIMLAALLVTVVTASWWVIKKPRGVIDPPIKNDMGLVSTKRGARTKLFLPDGSSVWLNAGSKLTYNKKFDMGNREVNLTGEAFFDVTKNTTRPFIIHTTKMDVKVTGTQFNVKAYDEDKTSETSLIEGSVEVYLLASPGKKYVLKPNEKLVLKQTAKASPGDTKQDTKVMEALPAVEIKQLTYQAGSNADVESNWTRNVLSFQDEAFTEVAKKMERWYDVHFEFKNKRWENEFLSGSFEKESLEQAMKALCFSTGFSFKINGKIILIY